MHKLLILTVILLTFFDVKASTDTRESDNTWKAGVASVIITPEKPMWMAGYGGRDHPAEGKVHDLWAKALALEDAKGKQVVLITTDLLGFPKIVSDRIRDELEAKFKLSRSQVILNSSHTHSGPVLEDALFSIYPLDAQQLALVEQYSDKLTAQVVELVGNALGALKPAKLYSENGVTRFQVNRRNNTEASLVDQTELNGPNDYAVPVIKVEDMDGGLMAVAFGYACHNTVLGIYDWSGDYAGFAQLELEKLYPGTTALFFQGAGADQNPLPRRTIPLARQYGKELTAAVERVLSEEMHSLPATLSTAYSEIKLPLSEPPTQAELEKKAKEASGYEARWAKMMLEQLASGKSLERTYDYPLQVWQLGDQPIIAMGGEVVVQYAIELKKLYGNKLFVMGYSNDVMAYIPSDVILQEGGYEGETSQMVYGRPSKWKEGIQDFILDEVKRLASELGLSKSKN